MALCNRTGCTHEAAWAPKLNVPILGLSPDQQAPISGIIGLKLCDDCIDLVKPEDFDNLRELFAQLAQGELETDWERAFFTKVALDSAEYELFLLTTASPATSTERLVPYGLADPRAPFPRALPPSAFKN